ncbi:MAG: RagB/SusD family nutrient uptake outer membrane protein [Flavobacterium sp.]|nr:RagB/SusD family nutrient uptake outer membrane protein [Pedobacter sp.]
MKLLSLTLGIALISTVSCSKLDDKTYGTISAATDEEAAKIIPPAAYLQGAYDALNSFADQGGVYALMEHSSDEMMGPTRGTDWDDNGVWRKIHLHTWDPIHDGVNAAWDRLNTGQFRATQAIAFSGESAQVKAEASFLRAWFMFYILDLFGQVPSRELSDPLDANPKVLTRIQAVDQSIADLIYAEANLTANTSSDKVTKQAAQALLAKIYLNKAVYSSASGGALNFVKADMDKVIEYSNKVVNSGKFSLLPSGKYFDNFSWNNTGTSELIFSIKNIPGDVRANPRFTWRMGTHYNMVTNGWNGFTTLADFYDSFEPSDERRGVALPGLTDVTGMRAGFLIGQQVDAAGKPLQGRNGPLILTRNVSLTASDDVQGIRVIKYAPQPDATGNIKDTDERQTDNDLVFLRYADVLLMKAEAVLRGGSDPLGQSPLQIVNNLRSTRGASPLSSVDNASLLAERGRELYYEGWRRQDQIRFGTFNDPVDQRPTKSASTKTIFPIPQKAIDTNPNLTQNPGY